MGLCSRALQYIENTSWKALAYGIYARSGAARCNKRRESWGENHTPLWLLIGRIIFLMCENRRSLLWLARTNLRTKIYDIAFWWVFLCMYIINIVIICQNFLIWSLLGVKLFLSITRQLLSQTFGNQSHWQFLRSTSTGSTWKKTQLKE